uniref:NGRIS-9 transposase n=1 Tax=Rhizobium meliloti TaxID=382 RepID=I2E1P0_RHIML|nr:NGRIS-9 transposase [Sinorhizobium meliloti]
MLNRDWAPKGTRGFETAAKVIQKPPHGATENIEGVKQGGGAMALVIMGRHRATTTLL